MSAVLTVDHLSIKKGRTQALKDVSFELQRGTITGLIGPSGSGKTTLMRSIVGAQAYKHGFVTVLGRPSGHASLRRTIGYVTQSPAVYLDLTVRQNLQYFASILGSPKTQINELLTRIDLTKQKNQLTGSLSGGQLARTSLAVALLGDPEVLVLDEPTVGQDPILRDALWQLFRELAEQGKTILVSSHIMNEASHCDSLLILRNGELMARTTADALKHATGKDDLDEAFLELVKSKKVDQ